MHKFWVLIGTLLTVTCPGRLLTTVPIEHLHDAREMRPAGEARELAAIGENDFVIVSGPADESEAYHLTRVTAERSVPLADLPPKHNGLCTGQGVVAAKDGSWWFGRCDAGSVLFVTSAAPSRVVTTSGADDAIGWTPIEGDEPAGVLLSFASPGESLIHAALTTPSGTRPLGDFERTGHIAYLPPTWQARRLDDGAIALVTLEEDDGEANRVMLRVFRDGALVTESRLPFARDHYVAIASAHGSHGLGVVAQQPAGGGLVAMVADPEAPQNARPHDIARSDAPLLSHAAPIIIPLGERFAVTWLNAQDRSVRLAEFDAGVALPAVTAGEEASMNGLLPMLQREEEGLTVFWSDHQRTLPENPTGYLLAAELWQLLR